MKKPHPLQMCIRDTDSWWKNKKQLFQKESIQKLRNRLMVVMCIPIKVDEMEELYLISFQDAEEIRNMEYKIRKQLREQEMCIRDRPWRQDSKPNRRITDGGGERSGEHNRLHPVHHRCFG